MSSQEERETFVRFPDTVDFYDRIENKTLDYNTAVRPEGNSLAGMLAEFPDLAILNDLFKKWDSSNTNVATRDPSQFFVFPRTWDDFSKSIRFTFGQATGNNRSGPMYEAFLQEFVNILKTSLGGTSGDFSLISEIDMEKQFIEMFNLFMCKYPFKVVNTGGIITYETGTVPEFIDKWREFLTITATQLESTAGGVRADAATFEQIFAAFFPNALRSDFKETLDEFAKEMEERDGFFNPSHHLADWFNKVKNKYLQSLLAVSSVEGTGADKLQIIWRLFALVVDMIGTIQNATASMANRLNVLTQLQKSYTDLMSKIPTAVKDQNPPIAGYNNDNYQDLNSKGDSLRENLRSFRSLVTDDSKQLQSTVNQLNEGVNQQANLATAILQQMSGILQSIFR